MKVWEFCNQLKGTKSTKKQIESWAYMNKICPLDFAEELEVEPKPVELNEIASQICHDGQKCNHSCLSRFLGSEVRTCKN